MLAPRVTFLFALALVLLGGARALANPFYIGRYGGLRADAVYTGAFAFYWNPAALARPGWDVAVDGMLITRQASFNRDATQNGVSAADAPYNAGLARSNSTSAVPAIAGRVGFVLGPVELGVGAAAFVDIAGTSRPDGACRRTRSWTTTRSPWTRGAVPSAAT